ncbi:hypothetical protein PRIPAC_91649 [Pristionchus pacificus]|uniref:Putative complexin-1 n=1 Tax=Pristionchus pacificus TaxID=54126 RepID=A0A2A6BBI2_PRIPA|nr:hypothetical protein PRIPAC_91649 [Pristionchus pacificus]|eukprot:PDM63230.1 hypothetical protein PRIPAC_50445 [Pristionchus pacificus]
MNMIVGSMLGNPLGGGLDHLTGSGDNEGEKTGEDPEVVAARLEQEERRKEKHRKQEAEREKMREGIRSKYNIQKKEEGVNMDFTEGRVGAVRKTPEQLAAEKAREESIIGQLGMTEHVDKAKATLTSAFETVKGFLPFGK